MKSRSPVVAGEACPARASSTEKGDKRQQSQASSRNERRFTARVTSPEDGHRGPVRRSCRRPSVFMILARWTATVLARGRVRCDFLFDCHRESFAGIGSSRGWTPLPLAFQDSLDVRPRSRDGFSRRDLRIAGRVPDQSHSEHAPIAFCAGFDRLTYPGIFRCAC